MNTFRLSAAALVVSMLFVIVWSVGAGGCSGPNELCGNNCFIPNPANTAADGGPDPCFCDVQPPLANCSCPCTSTHLYSDTGLTGEQVYHACMGMLTADAGDASDAGDAAEGGPLDAGDAGLATGSVPTCNGQCQPLPPAPGWEGPFLLSAGADGGPTECPDASTATVWGYGNGPFACGSKPSGACSDPREICGPASAEGFLTCVLQAGDVLCPSATQYADPHYETVGDNPPEQFTFCCLTPQSVPMPTGRSE